MTRSCSALGCTARDTGRSRERGISFHQFPVDAAQRREWIRAVNRVDPRSRRAWRPGPGAILCSRHFAEGDFERYGLRRKLRRGAVPSRFLPSVRAGSGRAPRCRRGPAVRPDLPSLPPPGAAGRRPQEEREPRPSAEAAAAQPARRGPQLQPAGPAGGRAGAARPAAPAAAARRRERRPRAAAQERAQLPQGAGGKAAALWGNREFAAGAVCSWLSNNEAAAGFSSDIFLQLQEKVERGDQACRYCAVLVQDVSLQKQQQWDPQSKQLMGFVDLGAGVLDADEAPLASEAIILMAVGIWSPWTAPLGYFLVSSTSGCFLAQLLRQAIHKLNSVGIVVLAVTAGASARGAETARALGIRIDPKRIQCTFQHPPGSAHSIAYFFDVRHALLLIRNALQCFQKVEWLGDPVWWQHVVELANLGEQKVLESGRAGSKGSYHLKVNLASLLFSEGAAEALEHLQKLGLASFQNCSGTVKFVRLMSSLCNVFYGRGPYGKEPLLAGNYTKISNLFDEARSCFVNLTDSVGRYIIKSKRKLGFLSFLLNAESLKWLSSNHTCPKGTPSHHLHTRAFSLDPLEQFLRALQQACGSSGSPTCAVFQAAYHKLLASCSLAPGSPPSSGPASPWDVALSQGRAVTLGSIRAQCHPAPGRTVAPEHPYSTGLLLPSSALSDALTDLSLCAQSLTCMAGWVAEQLALDLQCEACLASLFEADESRLRCRSVLYVKKLGGVSLPSASVHHITSISEQVLNRYSKVGGANKNTKLWHLCLEQKVFQELLEESPLFPTLTKHLFEEELSINNHYTLLVKEITRCYLNLRTCPTQHLNLKYPCGKYKLKRLKGKHLFPSPLGSCQ
ncbi:DNA transposase THAP9 isoform X3 [Passer domesticus]|uniref:DNA transposase THAP9 isoform X3 n=1 Tax=Passer domesticus TaxID=48849 RepID=UPI0030FE3890